ncbi:MAG TPA: TraR/DksA C4-type zinc finger protein [Chloroflexia bacterium]|nr:TraR/DksA C4-type zinc finger protein [Chloroflexia bacterium]
MADQDTEVTSIDVNEIKGRLLKLRAQLERDIAIKDHQVAEDGDDLDPERGGVSNHMADDANETAEQETMMTLRSSAERQLAHVNEALERIEDGSYGTCSNCGKPINPARLDALPFSTLCIDCQNLADKGRI